MADIRRNAQIIKQLSKTFGFDSCGISKAEFLEKEASLLENWLHQGLHGEMKYLENHFEKRMDPTKLVPGAKTVISLLYNYYPSKIRSHEDYQFAKYAYGQDYHTVVKEKCNALLSAIRLQCGDVQGRVFVDSAPVMERVWAEKSGIGWIGKHGLLINKQKGSYFFLAELILDIEAESDGPIRDYCGNCNKCVDACPTDAILPDKTLNASRCISYLTIELKNEIPIKFKEKMKNWVFGCDICQDVCPWNRFSSPNKEQSFQPKEQLMHMKNKEWDELNAETFDALFKGTAVERTGFKGLKRNINFLKIKS